jgi:hypothetical protein
MSDETKALGVSDEQLLYAKILDVGMNVGLVILLVTFALYASNIVKPAVPLDELPKYWSMSAHEYLEVTNHTFVHREHPITGWTWLTALNHGDYLNFVGIAVLSLVTVVCFLGIIPTLLRKKDVVYAVMSLLEALILGLAASGLLTIGGH